MSLGDQFALDCLHSQVFQVVTAFRDFHSDSRNRRHSDSHPFFVLDSTEISSIDRSLQPAFRKWIPEVGVITFVVHGRQSYSDRPFPIAMLARVISERLPAQEVIASQGRTFSLGLAESQFSLTRMS